MGAWRSGIKEELSVIDRRGGQPHSYAPVLPRLVQLLECVSRLFNAIGFLAISVPAMY